MRQHSIVKRDDTLSSDGEPLYHPSIFRYTCRGHVHLSSKLTGSPGICHGLKSQLEHVDHWRLVTREEAVRVFSQQSSSLAAGGDGGGVTGGVNGGNHGVAGGGGPARGGDVPEPTLTGDDATAHALEMALLSQVLIYPEDKDDDKKNKKDETTVHRKMIQKVSSRLPEEDLITSQDWDCYGWTELDLLVLRPQGETEEKVVAVAPYCSPGLSMRDIRSELGNDRTSTVRLGNFQVEVQSAAAPDDDDEESKHNNKNAPSSNSMTNNPFSQLFSKQKETSDNKNTTSSSSSSTNKDETSKASLSSSLSSAAEQFIKVSTKVAEHMQQNAKLIRDSVKEDFSGRTYAAGNRILNEFGTTLDRTVQLMEKVAKTIVGADDDGPDSKKPRDKK